MDVLRVVQPCRIRRNGLVQSVMVGSLLAVFAACTPDPVPTDSDDTEVTDDIEVSDDTDFDTDTDLDTDTDVDTDTDTDTDTDVDTDTDPPVALRVAVFSKTQGYRHGSIKDGLALLDDMAKSEGWSLSSTEDSSAFAAALPDTDVVVFLSPTGDVLDGAQQDALEAFVRGGGGWVGIHAAADCEYDWPFYGELVGAWFKRHPSVQSASIQVEDATVPATQDLDSPWERTDEWYDFRTNPRDRVQVLLTLDESSYRGGEMGEDHPIAWQHRIDSGRAFYTGLGHTSGTYEEPAFRSHLRGAIEWVSGR